MDARKEVDPPPEIALGSGATRTRFVPKRGFYAVHGWDEEQSDEHPVLVLDATAVFRGSRSARPRRKEGPVYESKPGGTPAVPTGRVFVRFPKTIAAESRAAQLRNAGYRIVSTMSWAPHTAWVESTTGDVADSLRNLHKLEQVKDIEHVEPQMLMPAAARV
jgi:hypothetical protein